MEALKAVSLMGPTRSTVGYRHRAAFPCALLTVEEVRDDVRRIGWEECPFGSILTVGSLADREAAVEEDFRRPISSEWGRTKRRRTRKRRRMLLPTTAAPNGRRWRGKWACSVRWISLPRQLTVGILRSRKKVASFLNFPTWFMYLFTTSNYFYIKKTN